MQCRTKIQLQPSGFGMGQRQDMRWPRCHTTQDAEHRGGDYPDQDRSSDFSRHQNEDDGESQAGQLRFLIREAAEAYNSCVIRNHKISIAQANEGYEHSYDG